MSNENPKGYIEFDGKKHEVEITGIDIGLDPDVTAITQTHPNCKTSITMGDFSDIVQRHKKVEEMRRQAAQARKMREIQLNTQPTLYGNHMTTAIDDLRKALANDPYSPLSGGYLQGANPPKKATKPKPKPIKKTVEFDSVILEDEKKQAVLEALEQLDKHELIFEKWGFAKTLEKGKAVSMLFYGEPGTGKTLLAQAIADKLDKKLKIIGSAEIESSEPGAAERNIKAFFEQTKSDTVLLFDECDSLVYDRQQVGSILAAQVNQLLSSLEKFEGVVIFTTNRLGVLDEAFNRRLSLKLEFLLPDFQQRIKIWKRMFPKEAPLAKDINWNKLAEPEIAGGHIKNAVLRAARTAAAQKLKKGQKKKITQAILSKALKDEIREMVSFMDAKDKQGTLPRQVGYTLRKTT